MTTQTVESVASKPERRETQRKKFRGKLEMEWGSAILTGTVTDIGPRGLFVEILPPLWLGAAFRARLILNPILLLDCKVVRIEPARGMATSFEIPEESGKAQLQLLLASLPPV